MRLLCSILGNALLAAGLGGLVLLARDLPGTGVGAVAPPPVGTTRSLGERPTPLGPDPWAGDAAITDHASGEAPAREADLPEPAHAAPISRIVLPRIGLAADVVPARLVQQDGEATWEVPAFAAGHAERTAGAGEPGTAVLIGHVGSRAAGAVFRDLGRARPGDIAHAFSGARRIDYRVVDARAVAPTDLAVLRPIERVSLALVTCTGWWLPLAGAYAERLVVRAELAAAVAP